MMLRVRLSRFLNFQFGAFAVLLALIHSCGGQHHVIGSSHPVVATLGDDVILPCRLDPLTTALKLTVEWTRPDLRPRFVLVLRQTVELDNKHPAYEGRTSLFSDELKLGNISLKLSRVRTSDEGGYRCFVPELNRDTAVQLIVGAASSPVIQMIKNSSSIVLQCNSTGWYPEPEVFWLDGEGNLLSAGPPETVRGPDDLYTVSSRVTVEKRHSNSFTCRVTQKKTNQTRETTIQVPVSDDFVEVPSARSPTSSVPAIVGAVLGIMFILAVVAGCFLWKWRRNKIQNKRRNLEDRAEHIKGEKTEGEEESFQLTESEEREREPQLERQDVVEKEEETNERGFIHVTQRNDSERVKRKQKEEEVYHDHQQQTVRKRKPEEEDTVQTEEDVKTTNQDVHMESDEDEPDEHRVCEPLSVLSWPQHTAQTEDDRKMRNRDNEMEVDEEAGAHTEQEVISDSERWDCDSEVESISFRMFYNIYDMLQLTNSK